MKPKRISVGRTTPKKILIAEDSRDIREAMTELLRDEGYEVRSVGDGYEATTVFEEFRPDLVILDDHMPMMNGADVCAVIRRTSDVPVIMFTAGDEVVKVQGAIGKGVTDFVLKFTGIDELVDRVASHLERSTQLDSASDIQLIETATIRNPEKFTATVLIVDPDESVRNEIIDVLRRRSQNYIEVTSAADAKIAIERFNPDVLMVEWALPGEDVFKLLSEALHGAVSQQSSRVVMSNRIPYEVERKCRFIGIQNYLVKPIKAAELDVVIGTCIKVASTRATSRNQRAS